MDSSIAASLGIGSGLDIKALVKQLSDAQRAPKDAQIERRETLNAARISTLAEVSGAIDNFSNALSSLISGGSLFTQPTVSEPSLLSVKAVAGARLGGLSAELEVVQLAKAQTLESATFSARTDPVGQGTLTLANANGSFDIVIDASNDSLEGLAAAINAAGAGVVASIVTDANGSRLMMKGATGQANAFTLSTAATGGLERFAFGPSITGGMSQAQAAQDAIVKLDGVTINRSSNSFSDVVAGVQIDLKKAEPGTIISLGASRPTAEITQGMTDFVAAYNELMALINEATKAGAGEDGGPLRGDVGVRQMMRQLSQMTSMALTSQGDGPHSLAEIGVRTNRDGTLSLDTFRLQEQLVNNPDAVEALFNPTQWSSSSAVTIQSAVGRVKPGTYTLTNLVPMSGSTPASGMVDGVAMTGVDTNLVAPAGSAALGLIVTVNSASPSVTITIEPGLGGALKMIRDALRDREGPFGATNKRLTEERDDIADMKALNEERSQRYYNQLLGTFTAMERQVSSFKATQSYLDQQIKMWTNDRG
ncbi:MAG: flagellar filament capping protein FliD [Allosphingosinicella sp.]|uniref:flagellar filament capping protein FliD n=1 Tax=Allosphingosinicella sp. TaxID=2823234 RepID=UPI003939189B